MVRKNKTRKLKQSKIVSNFDSGSIKVLSENIGEKICHFNLALQKEKIAYGNKSHYWFYFKVCNVKNKMCYFNLKSHIDCNNGFKNLKVATSYDNKKWFRYKTNQQNKKTRCKGKYVSSTHLLKWKIKPKHDVIWFAYYIPYPLNRVYKCIKEISKKGFVKTKTIGYSSNNKKIKMLTIGNGARNVWIIGRQHPGETVGSWIVEGFLKSVISPLKNITLRIIPCINPDGVYNGYWYTNKNGVNLNLDWTSKKTKEVKIVSKLLDKQYNDLILDVHGDEECKKHFLTHCPKKNFELYSKLNKLLCESSKRFSPKDFYIKLNLPCDGKTLDHRDNALTLEGCMKHPFGDINNEGLLVGKTLYKTLKKLYN